MANQEPNKVIAVSVQDAQAFGCPHCGDIYGTSPMGGGGAQLWNCSSCKKTSIYLAEGVTKSPISCGNQTPVLEPHPRRHLGPVDREKIAQDRERNIEASALTDLQKWMSLGHEQPVRISKVGSHTSKSCHLPIVATDGPGNVRVSWFANNWYFYFLGIELMRPIPAILLYPISSIFGDYALSGHVNTEIAPPLRNFQKEYCNNALVKKFGGSTNGIGTAMVIRYLEEVSKLDFKAITDVCLNKTNYGPMDVIDGNAISFEKLVKLLGISDKERVTYDFKLENLPIDIFEEIEVDWFDTNLGKSSVHVTLPEGIYLPPMTLPADIYVDLKDTALDRYIPQDVQERPLQYGDYLLKRVPTWLLHYQEENMKEMYSKLQSGKIHGVYSVLNKGTRKLTFNTPTVLDCAMTAFFLIRVVAPILRQISKE